MKRAAAGAVSVGVFVIAQGGALAQTAGPPPAAAVGPAQAAQIVVKPDEASARKEGVNPGAAVGATFNLSDNRSVVGQPDGSAVTLGAAVDASVEYNHAESEWRSNLGASAGVTRTPTIHEYLKTRDALTAETIYLYHVVPAFGPFARVGMATQMFAATDVRAASVSYAIAHVDGTTEALVGRRLHLTDSFQPLTLKESVGAFVQPLTSDRMRLEVRAGGGAQEVFASGALSIADDEATPAVVEVKELDSFNQLGLEAVANAWGTIDEAKRIAYTVGLGVLLPLVHTDLAPGDDRSSAELTDIELTAGLSVKLLEWASLDYKLAVLRQPQLVDETQVSNNILLTIGFGVGSKAPTPPAPPAPVCPPEPAAAPAPAPAPAAPAPAPAAPAPAAPPPASPAPAAPAPEATPPPAAPAPAAPPAPGGGAP